MNWLQKLASTGYLDTQPFGQTYRRWDEIKERRNALRSYWREKAEKIAKENGHTLRSWSSINGNWCDRCGREIHLHNVISRGGAQITGRALFQKCDDPIWNTAEDVVQYNGINAFLE